MVIERSSKTKQSTTRKAAKKRNSTLCDKSKLATAFPKVKVVPQILAVQTRLLLRIGVKF